MGIHRGSIDTTRLAVENTGRRFHALEAVLSVVDASTCATLVEGALTAAGRIDVLVNNAGAITRCPALEVTESQWHQVLHINLTANLSTHPGRRPPPPLLRQPGNGSPRGKVINIASMLSFQGGMNVAAYTA